MEKDPYTIPKIFTKGNSLKHRWYVAFYFLHPETGKMERHTHWISSKLLTVEARMRKALDLKSQLEERLKRGWSPYQEENIKYTTLVEAFDNLIRFKGKTLRRRSVGTYQSIYNNLLDWLQEHNKKNITLEQFNYRTAQAFFDYLKIEKNLNNRSYNNHVRQLRTFYHQLIRREYTNYNPITKVELLPEQAPNVNPVTQEELIAYKEYLSVHEPRLWLVCQFIFYTFIRPNELVQLRVKDISLKEEKITVPADVSKNRRQQAVSIPQPFLPVLQELKLHELPPDYLIFSKNLEPGTFKIAPTRLAERFKKHTEVIGLKHVLYDLKHTGAGMALEAGVKADDLMNQLRHSDLATTTKYIRKFKNVAGEDFKSRFPKIA